MITGCGQSQSASLDAKLTRVEGYQVTGCRELPSIEAVGREIGDYGVHVYGCNGGIGVAIEADGAVSDFPIPVQQPPHKLTAADIDARIIAQAKRQFGVTPKRVDCGKSIDVAPGSTLRCTITLPTGKTATFPAAVRGGPVNFTVTLS